MKKIIIFTLLMVLLLSALCACSQNSQGIGETGISAEEFDSLYLGMAKDRVNETIGGTGELISESKDEDNNYIVHKRIYRYEGESGGYAELEFTHRVAKDVAERISNHNVSSLSAKTKYDLE